MKSNHPLATALCSVLVALSASASPWLTEPFEIDSIETLTNTLTGTGWHPDTPWAFTTPTNTPSPSLALVPNLSFGTLVTSGAALEIHNPNKREGYLQRTLNIPLPPSHSSVWFSYLVHYTGPTASGSYQTQTFGWSIYDSTKDTTNLAEALTYECRSFNAGTWDKVMTSLAEADNKNEKTADWLMPPTSDTTYLVITAITNIALPRWSSNEDTTLRQWVLSRADFETLTPDGVLNTSFDEPAFCAHLDEHCQSVVSESKNGGWSSYNIGSNDLFRIHFALNRYNNPTATYILDELRMGPTYRDILPTIDRATRIILR